VEEAREGRRLSLGAAAFWFAWLCAGLLLELLATALCLLVTLSFAMNQYDAWVTGTAFGLMALLIVSVLVAWGAWGGAVGARGLSPRAARGASSLLPALVIELTGLLGVSPPVRDLPGQYSSWGYLATGLVTIGLVAMIAGQWLGALVRARRQRLVEPARQRVPEGGIVPARTEPDGSPLAASDGALPVAPPQEGPAGPASALTLILGYLTALLVGDGVTFAVFVGLTLAPAALVGDHEWVVWSIPFFEAICAAGATALLARVLQPRMPSRSWMIVWSWTGLIFFTAGLLAAVVPPESPAAFMSDAPGRYWALAAGGLAGFWLGNKSAPTRAG
jgi:hypothetical protein